MRIKKIGWRKAFKEAWHTIENIDFVATNTDTNGYAIEGVAIEARKDDFRRFIANSLNIEPSGSEYVYLYAGYMAGRNDQTTATLNAFAKINADLDQGLKANNNLSTVRTQRQ